MKAENVWGLVFAGIAALTGIIYVLKSGSGASAQPVTNLFPPLNTSDPALTDEGYDEPTTGAATVPVGNSAATSQKPTPWPVYIV